MGAIARAHTQSFARGDEGTPTPPQRHFYTQAEQGSPDGSPKAGASPKLGLEAHEHCAATVVTENDRLCAMEVGPAAQVCHLVIAEPGERAAECFGRVHAQLFNVLLDMMSMPGDSMSCAIATASLPRAGRRAYTWGHEMFNGAHRLCTFVIGIMCTWPEETAAGARSTPKENAGVSTSQLQPVSQCR